MEARPKRYTYKVEVEWKGEKKAFARSEGKPVLEVATPPEFKGHLGIWSPEDFFVEAVNSCIMTTFLSFADRAAITLARYSSEAEGVLELKEKGFVFTTILVKPKIAVRSEEDRVKATELIHKVESACLISNSIKSEVTIEPEVVVV